METFDADIEGVSTQRHKRLDILHCSLFVREGKDTGDLGVLILLSKVFLVIVYKPNETTSPGVGALTRPGLDGKYLLCNLALLQTAQLRLNS